MRISTVYNRVTTSNVLFQSGGISIMDVNEVSCRAMAIDQEFRNPGNWSWMVWGKNHLITIIITV